MLAVIVHEVSHGWLALRLGDPTALEAGRLTLNPFKHIDPVGTVLLPMVMLVMRAPFVFGWAKPVPINAMNLRHPKRDMLWVGAAGPAANFLLAFSVALCLKVAGGWIPPIGISLAKTLILINLVLGTFNLLPIPPLDGSRILVGILPVPWARILLNLESWGIVLVFGLLYLGFMDRILWPTVSLLARLLGV
jgi:Zn-dependent protease